MKIEDLNISSHTGIDECGRVFFHKGRVLRAINPHAENWVREFLSSDLYCKLIEKGWFVRTWVVDDIKIDDFSLILESERVYACQWQLLTFSQLKDTSILAIKINTLCNQYGWALFDDWFNNFGLKNGQLIYFDLGGFFKIGQRQLPELTDQVIEWKIIRLMSLGMGSLAKSIKPWPEANNNDSLYPTSHSKLDDLLEATFHPIVAEYTVYRKKSKPAIFRFKSLFSLTLIHRINRIAERITKKSFPWRLLYIEPAYQLTDLNFKNIIPHYANKTDIEYLDGDIIRYFISNNNLIKSLHSILIYGEYHLADLEKISVAFGGKIWICSPSLIYTDYIYEKIKRRQLNIGVLSYNFCFNTIHDNEKIMELGVDCLLCHSSSIAGISEANEPTYFLGKLSNYFNHVFLENHGKYERYIKEKRIFQCVTND